MRTKLHHLKTISPTIPHDIILLTETWLNEDISSSELGLNHYNIYRLDRNRITSNKTKGGGVMVCISKNISSSKLPVKHKNVEQIFVMLKISTRKIIIACTYIPPTSDLQIYKNHTEDVEILKHKYPKAKFIIVGDYNLPKIDWSFDIDNGAVVNETEVQCAKSKEMLDLSLFLGLKQLNKVHNSNNRILDLVFSNDSKTVVEQSDEMLLPLDHHHPALDIIITNESTNLLNLKTSSYNFTKADYPNIIDYLDHLDWSFLEDENNITNQVHHFYSFLNTSKELYVPRTNFKASFYPTWFSKELKELIHNKKYMHRLYKQSRNVNDYTIFTNLRRQCKELSRKCYNDYVSSIEKEVHLNVKRLWKFSNAQRKNDCGLPNTMYLNNKCADSTEGIVNLFADSFKNVYDFDIPDEIPNDISLEESLNLSHCFIEVNAIEKGIRALDTNKSAGPDGFPPLFLKSCINSLTYPLFRLFNKSLSSGCFPDQWKKSYLTPIHKKGDKSDVSNYRPICILSAIPKLFESLVLDVIIKQINNIIVPTQHGFIKGRSTLSNLIIYENYITDSLALKHQVDSIYTDFSKAFDKVRRHILVHKLSLMGIRGTLLSWINSYLSKRKLCVKINSVESYIFEATSGVPQGSHLGPILFLLFINDIVSVFKDVQVLLFADDLKIYKMIRSIHDCHILQYNLDRLYHWCTINSLFLNIQKCQVIRFCKVQSHIIYEYSLNNVKLTPVAHIRDLGVTFDEKLTFVIHVNEITNRAVKMLGFICRTASDFKSLECLKTLYTSLVRSQVEYNSPIWSPLYKTHSENIERVQHKFLRFINFKLNIPIQNINYILLMKQLNLITLSDRRIISDLVLLNKIINDCIDSPEILAKIKLYVPTRNTRQNATFFCDNFKTNYQAHAPINRLHYFGNRFGNIVDIFKDSILVMKRNLHNHFSGMYEFTTP